MLRLGTSIKRDAPSLGVAVGRFVYGSSAIAEVFDDRLLAHLKIVITSKLRRDESFSFTWSRSEDGRELQVTIWLSRGTPLLFEYDATADSGLNREWLEDLSRSANSTAGLHVVPEPHRD